MKKTSLLTLLIVLLVSFSLHSQEREQRSLDGFTGISVGGGVDLFITQASDFEVEVVSDKDIDDIDTYVKNGVLYIKERSNSWGSWNRKREVFVKLPVLEMLKASGGSDVENRSALSGNKLELSTSGGSDVELDLDYKELDIDCSGGSDLSLTGTTGILWLESGGGSDFEGFGLKSKEAYIKCGGASDVDVYATEKLEVDASGSSDVTYRGNPEMVDLNSSGGSDIDRG